MPNEKNNIPAKIAKIFLDNRTVSVVFLIVIVFLGFVCFSASPKAKDPEINIPKFQISFDYPGATAEEAEEFITVNVEQLITDLPNVKKISSVSIDGGKAVITVEFETFVNIEQAKIDVLSKLNENEDIIRNAGLSSPVIKNLDSNAIVIMEIGFTSDTLSQNDLRFRVDDIMNDLKKVPGVSNLEVRGGDVRALRITPDPGKMQILNVSAMDIMNAIRSSNIKVPSGIVRQGDRYKQIEVNGTFLEKNRAETILVKPGIQIKDIATVDDYYPEKTSSSAIWRDGAIKDAVYIGVAKVKGQNAQTVVDGVVSALDGEMKQDKYSGIHYAFYRDDGEKATEAVKDLRREIIIALVAVLIVLIYFLNFRTAVTVASALPLALMVAFVGAYLNHVTISEFALFGLIIALGLLVDSATVVVEGAYEYIQHGVGKKEAFTKILNESGVSIFVANLAMIIVFVPLTMISGTVGQYVFPAVFFIICSLFGSLIMAYTEVPFIGSILLRKEKEVKKENFLDKIRDKYVILLEKILRSRKKQITFAVGVLIALVLATLLPVFGFIKIKSMTGGNTYKYSIYIDGPDGMDVGRTQEVTDKVVSVIMDKPHVESVQTFIAEPMIADISSVARNSDSRNTPNVSTVKVNLKEELAADDFENYIDSVRRDINENEDIKKIENEENVKIKVLMDPSTPLPATVALRVMGPRQEIREKVARDMEVILANLQGLIYVDDSMGDAFPKIVYKVDHDKALNSGVTATQVSSALQTALGPYQISQFHVPGLKEPAMIELQFARQDRDQLSDLPKIFITNTNGESVPLDSVVDKVETRNEPDRYRYAKDYATYVSAETQKVPTADIAKEITKKIENSYSFPEGGKLVRVNKERFDFALPNGEKYGIEWGGEVENTNDTNNDLGSAMALAFIAIIIIFIARFNSVKRALIVVSAIPLSFIGVFPAFAVLFPLIGLYFTSMSMIGIIALMGIVVNNSILLISYYEMIKEESGMDSIHAFLESGRKRFRPILLTTTTAILGNFVMLFDPTWNSLAWTIIAGLFVSACLVMFMVPILYTLLIKQISRPT